MCETQHMCSDMLYMWMDCTHIQLRLNVLTETSRGRCVCRYLELYTMHLGWLIVTGVVQTAKLNGTSGV